MYYKGIVFEILEHSVIILTDEQQFIKIKKKEGLEIGQTILCIPEDVIQPPPKIVPFYKKTNIVMTILAACLLLFLMPFNEKVTPYAVLSVDVNPSFEFELDEQMKIINVMALNDSAKQLKVKSLKGLPLSEGITKLKEILIENNISLDSNAMLFSLALSNQDDLNYENQVKDSLKTVNTEEEFAYLKITEDELRLAHEQSVSGAKLKVKQLLKDIDIDNLSVNEMIQLFKDNQLHFDLLFKNGVEIDDDLEDKIDDLLDELDDEYHEFDEDDDDDQDLDDDDDDDQDLDDDDDDDQDHDDEDDDQDDDNE